MARRSSYQDRVIRNYYRNQDAIVLQRLGEMVTELYLAEGKGRSRLWQRVAACLGRLEIPQERIGHVVAGDNPSLLANLVKELLDRK
jgi:heme oxygenase